MSDTSTYVQVLMSDGVLMQHSSLCPFFASKNPYPPVRAVVTKTWHVQLPPAIGQMAKKQDYLHIKIFKQLILFLDIRSVTWSATERLCLGIKRNEIKRHSSIKRRAWCSGGAVHLWLEVQSWSARPTFLWPGLHLAWQLCLSPSECNGQRECGLDRALVITLNNSPYVGVVSSCCCLLSLYDLRAKCIESPTLPCLIFRSNI